VLTNCPPQFVPASLNSLTVSLDPPCVCNKRYFRYKSQVFHHHHHHDITAPLSSGNGSFKMSGQMSARKMGHSDQVFYQSQILRSSHQRPVLRKRSVKAHFAVGFPPEYIVRKTGWHRKPHYLMMGHCVSRGDGRPYNQSRVIDPHAVIPCFP